MHAERYKGLNRVNPDYEEPEFAAQATFSTDLNDHVDRSEAYCRVIPTKRCHMHRKL